MIGVQRLELEGKRFVVIDESEYERLCREAGEAADTGELPEFPKPDKHGRFPALEYTPGATGGRSGPPVLFRRSNFATITGESKPSPASPGTLQDGLTAR